MPLYTKIECDGKALSLNWGWWHVQCMQDAAILDIHGKLPDTSDPEYVELWRITPLALYGRQVLGVDFDVTFRDPADGEILKLKTGDVLYMVR